MAVKIDLKSPIEDRIKAINGISDTPVLEALLLKSPASDDEGIAKEWEVTKAIIRARIDQLKESEKNAPVDVKQAEEKTNATKRKKASNVLALIALVLTTAYLIYLMFYISTTYSEATSNVQSWEGLGTAIGTALAIRMVLPHVAIVFVAFIFNLVTAIARRGWAALTSGILYAVSILLMPLWFVFVVVQTVLCFVQFAKCRKAVKAVS